MSYSNATTCINYPPFVKYSFMTCLSFLLIIACYLWIDKPVALFFHDLNLKTQAPWLLWFTEAGKAVLYVTVFFLLMLFFRFIKIDIKKEMQMRFLLLCVLIPNVICLFLKTLLGRARPELWFTEQQYGFFGVKFNKLYWSFPSSHASTVMGLTVGACILFPRYKVFFLLSGLFIMASRVVLLQHYVSDIVAAVILTLMELGILMFFLKRKAWFFNSLP